MNFSPLRRKLGLWAGLLLVAGTIWLGVYAWDSGFTRKWRGMIAKELAKHGLRAEIGRLTLDPVEGLTARDVKLFDMTHRDQHLADINSISLDIDVARLMNQEPFLRTINLQKADVALPVDPGDDKSEWLTVRGLTARLVFENDRIEIARAEGLVSGILVKITGAVRKPSSKPQTREEQDRRREERTRQLRQMRDRRGALRSVLRVLDRFQIVENHEGAKRFNKAELDLDIHGDLNNLNSLEIRAALSGGALEYAGGRVESFRAGAGLSAGTLTLKSLEVRDGRGALHANASWKIRPEAPVELAVESSIDWQPLLRSIFDEAPWLGEVVFYTPPEWEWDGRFFPGETGDRKWPVEGQGRFKSRRFTTRGVVFEGLEAQFSVRADGSVYVREGLLAHHTGTVRGQVLAGPEKGRYELEWLMSVNAAAPFIGDPVLRKVLERFSFQNQSRVAVRMGGQRGPDKVWRHTGRVEMHDFAYQQTPLQEVSGEVVIDPAVSPSVKISNVLIRMDDGTGTAKEVSLDLTRRLLRIVDGVSTLAPPRFINLFLPALAKELEKYRFDQPPDARIAGIIDLKGLERSDYQISVKARSRCGLDIADEPYTFDQVTGTAHILGPELKLRLAGATVAGTTGFRTLRLDDVGPATFEGTFSLLKENRPPPAWNVRITAPGRVSVLVLKRTWPLDQFVGRLTCANNQLAVTGGAQLFGGKFGASLEFPQASKPAHKASIVLDRVSFARLAGVIDPSRKTEGWVTGNFSYEMETSRSETLKGAGEARLEDGNIFALPLLGPLSGLLKAILPGENAGYSVARTATTTLQVEKGKVNLPDFEAATGTFRLTAAGSVDYVKDRVDMLARVNLRGAPGLLLFPVSKLFEYSADGTMAEPDWHARFFTSPFRKSTESGEEKEEETPPAPPLVPRFPGNR